jgi:hypothetical protein
VGERKADEMTKRTFHGLGELDKLLRQVSKGLERLPVKQEGKTDFVNAETGEVCSAQESLFQYCGLHLNVLREPSEWYSHHRKPTIVESNREQTRVLVRFGA